MKTCEALRSEGFHSVTTIEFRLRTINYAEVQLDVPDFGFYPAASPAPTAITKSDGGGDRGAASAVGLDSGAVRAGVANGGGGMDGGSSAAPNTASATVDGAAVDGSEVAPPAQSASLVGCKPSAAGGEENGHGADGKKEVPKGCESATSTECGGKQDGVSRGGESVTPDNDGANNVACDASADAVAGSKNKRPREETGDAGAAQAEEGFNAGRGRNERLQPKAAIRAAAAATAAATAKGVGRKPPLKLVCAQPFPTMRGHTAFLTFATTPVVRPPPAAAARVEAGAEGAVTEARSTAGSADVDSALNAPNNGAGEEMDVGCEEKEVEGEGKGKAGEKVADEGEGSLAVSQNSDDPSEPRR